MDQLALTNSLLVAARLLQGGDAEQAVTLLQPVVRRIGTLAALALPIAVSDVVRSFYPAAPEGWV